MAGTPVTSCARMTVPMPRFQCGPRGARVLPDRHDVLGNEHMGDAGKREQPLGEGRTSGQFFGVEKEGTARMHRPAYGELARVGIGDGGLGADRDRRVDRQDIRHLRRPWPRRAQRGPAGA
jgi:hypothetical protein